MYDVKLALTAISVLIEVYFDNNIENANLLHIEPMQPNNGKAGFLAVYQDTTTKDVLYMPFSYKVLPVVEKGMKKAEAIQTLKSTYQLIA